MTDLVIVLLSHFCTGGASYVFTRYYHYRNPTQSSNFYSFWRAPTPQIVLTTAHVVDGVDQVRISTQPTYQPSESSQWTEVLKNGCIIHPDYNPKSKNHFLNMTLLYYF